MAAADYFTQILWMKEALKDVDICIDQLITIHCDNTSAISLNENPKDQTHTNQVSFPP